MITECTGNMFNHPHTALVCPVNMVGTMGNGLALYFKQRIAGLFKFYQRACYDTAFKNFRSVVFHDSFPKVILFPTKVHWKNPSKLDWINKGLQELKDVCLKEGIDQLAIPAIGCGKGQLAWEDVRFLIYHHFENSAVIVHLYSPP